MTTENVCDFCGAPESEKALEEAGAHGHVGFMCVGSCGFQCPTRRRVENVSIEDLDALEIDCEKADLYCQNVEIGTAKMYAILALARRAMAQTESG